MQDRIKEQLESSGLLQRSTFLCELLTELTDHSFGYFQLPAGQVFKEIPALIDGNAAIFIQQEKECFDRRAIVDIIDHTDRELCMTNLSCSGVTIGVRFVFNYIQTYTYIDQLLDDSPVCPSENRVIKDFVVVGAKRFGLVSVFFGHVPDAWADRRDSCLCLYDY